MAVSQVPAVPRDDTPRVAQVGQVRRVDVLAPAVDGRLGSALAFRPPISLRQVRPDSKRNLFAIILTQDKVVWIAFAGLDLIRCFRHDELSTPILRLLESQAAVDPHEVGR
jgi:hypothetical protein